MAELTQNGRRDAVVQIDDGGSDLVFWEGRYKNGLADRARYHHIWHLCQSYIQGRQWIAWSKRLKRVIDEPNPDDRVRVTVNVLTPLLWSFVGKLTAEDIRPDLTFRREDVGSRRFSEEARASFNYGWDEESSGDEVVLDAVLKMGTFGTSGIRAYPDASWGPKTGEYPIGQDGRAIMDESRHEYVSEAFKRGDPVEYKVMNQGRICLEPLSPFNIVTPPGVEREQNFPWIIFERPVAITELVLRYGEKAKALVPENLRAIDMIGVREPLEDDAGAGGSGKLENHVMFKCAYELPTAEHVQGRSFCWAGKVELSNRERLPFIVNGIPKVGWVPLHCHRVPGRFWGVGVVEPGIGPQRQRNRARSQWIEMKDRAGLGRVFAYTGTIDEVTRPKGGVFELVECAPGYDFPKETQGVPPGDWLQAEVAQNDSDMERVSGLHDVSLGQAPGNISAYASLSLLAEQDDKRVGPVAKLLRLQVGNLAKIYLAGMREYWPSQKLVAVADDDAEGLLNEFLFEAAKLPEMIYTEGGKGPPLPQSQAAEAQKIFDLFDRSISSGQALPLDWLYGSLTAGKAQPLPKREAQVQADKADLENMLLIHGTPVQLAPYDNDELHVQRHRAALAALALIPSMQEVGMAIEQHVQEHLASATSKSAQASPGSPGTPPAPSGAVGGQQAGMGAFGATAPLATAGGQPQLPLQA